MKLDFFKTLPRAYNSLVNHVKRRLSYKNLQATFE